MRQLRQGETPTPMHGDIAVTGAARKDLLSRVSLPTCTGQFKRRSLVSTRWSP